MRNHIVLGILLLQQKGVQFAYVISHCQVFPDRHKTAWQKGGSLGLFHPYMWSYGPLLITGRDVGHWLAQASQGIQGRRVPNIWAICQYACFFICWSFSCLQLHHELFKNHVATNMNTPQQNNHHAFYTSNLIVFQMEADEAWRVASFAIGTSCPLQKDFRITRILIFFRQPGILLTKRFTCQW